MADFVIDDEILRRLEKIAEREQRPLNDVLRTMVETYPEAPANTDDKLKYPDWLPRTAESPDYDPIEDFFGMFEDDITDLSTLTKEDIRDAYRKKYGDPD
jgi:hypothetical protein